MTIDVTPVADPTTGEPAISGTAQVGHPLTADTSAIIGRGRVGQRQLRLPMDRRGRRHRDRHRRSDGLDLQAGRRRPGQDDQGAGELRRRRGHRPDADQRRNRHDTAERRHAGGDRRHGELDAAADIGRSDQPRHLRQARAHRIHRAVPPGGNGNRHADVHLHAGHSTRQATYYAGSGTDTLRFSYAVSGGSSDVDADGISWQANAIALNGGTITRPDLTSTAATLEHDAAGNQPEHKVDGRIGVTLTTVVRVEPASTPELRSDTYPPGEVIRIAVTVSGGDGGGRPAARFSPASRRSQADGLRPTRGQQHRHYAGVQLYGIGDGRGPPTASRSATTGRRGTSTPTTSSAQVRRR